MPFFALICSFSFVWLLGFLWIPNLDILIMAFLVLSVLGVILGIISLCIGIKQKRKLSIFLSIVAILAPICLVLYLQFIWGGP